MRGAWEVHPVGQRWRRAPRRAFLPLTATGIEAVEFDGPVLEVLTRAQLAVHPVISRLGPDVCAAALGLDAVVGRIRGGDPATLIVDVLRDQRMVSGVGNVGAWEALFACRVAPYRTAGGLPDACGGS